MKVLDVQHKGQIDLRRILDLDDYYDSVKEFRDKGVVLPSYNLLTRCIKEPKDMRINLSRLEIVVDCDEVTYFYTFLPGFIYDTASVPNVLRSVSDNDDERLVNASYVHDANFACHFLGFRQSNKLFYHMIRKEGGSVPFGAWCFIGVSSPVGRKAYESYASEKYRAFSPFVQFRCEYKK